MYFHLERVVEPDIEVISLDEMRRHLRLFDDVRDDDDDVTDLIVGSRQWVEQYTGRALIDQQWRLTVTSADGFFGAVGDIVGGYIGAGSVIGTFNATGGGLPLRRSPILEVVSVLSIGSDGVETTVDPTGYSLRGAKSKYPELVMLNGGSFSSGTFTILMRAGYTDRMGSPAQGAEMVPKVYKQAMKLWTSAHYDADVQAMPAMVKAAEAIIRGECTNVPIA